MNKQTAISLWDKIFDLLRDDEEFITTLSGFVSTPYDQMALPRMFATTWHGALCGEEERKIGP